jgi:hypothetical protein
VNGQGCLGIYLTREKATVVCLDSPRVSAEVIACFEVSPPQSDLPGSFAELADRIAQLCSQRDLQFSHVAVAVDCSLHMQHDVHSSFSDKKQIESTVRFDTEEALATDISDVALAFGILSSDESGSALRVFTSQKTMLSEMINALVANNLDPVTVEPDVACLCRFITSRYFEKQTPPDGILFAALSESNGYLIGPLRSDSETAIIQRTFLIAPGQDRNNVLLRQIPLSIARLGPEVTLNKLILLDSAGSLQGDRLASSFGLAAESADIVPPEGCNNPVAFAAACGAALSGLQKEPHISFRSDYMPYLGKRRRLEKTLKIVSISASVILVAVGLNLTLRLMQKNKPVKLLRENLSVDYLAALPNKEKMPSKLTVARKDLKKARDDIERIRNGQLSAAGEQSIPARLTAVMQAFNAVASDINLNIEKISITAKNITLTGNTSNRSNTLKLLAEIKKTMNVQQENLGTQAGRDTFSITAVPKTSG